VKTKKTIETTTEELSYMEVPGGPVDPKKGALVVWRVERTTQRQSMRGTRKYKPGAPKTHVRTGMGWEKQVARGGRGKLAEVQHPGEGGDNGDAEGDGYVSLGSKAALAMAEQFSDEMDAAAQAADDEQRESSALSRARAMAAAAYMGDRW